MDNPQYPQCPDWAKYGLCDSDYEDHDWIIANCKKSCGKCDSGKNAFTI